MARVAAPLLALLLGQAPVAADTLVVANKSAASVSLIDLASGEVRATLAVGEGPHEVAVSPSGRLALVANYGASRPGSTLTLLDVARAEVVRTIDLGAPRRPHGVAFLDERRALVTAEESRALLEVDVEAGRVLRELATGQQVSHMVAVTPGGERAFVANIGSGSVSVFDLASGAKLADVATGDGAEGIAVSPDGASVWVTNRAADTVAEIDAASLEVRRRLEAAGFPIRARLTPDGSRLLVSCARSGELAVLDAATGATQARISFATKGSGEGRLFQTFGDSPAPVGLVVAPDGRRAFVALTNADRIAIVDLGTLAVTGELVAGREPDGMAHSPVAAP